MSDFSLNGRTLLLTTAGSRAYGMHTETSDLDVKGVFVPPLKYYFGTKRVEQIDDKAQIHEVFKQYLTPELLLVADTNGMEGTVFEIHRFLELASGANPNILDILFCRDDDVIFSTPYGRHLREIRQKFLTKKCLQTFVGYATA